MAKLDSESGIRHNAVLAFDFAFVQSLPVCLPLLRLSTSTFHCFLETVGSHFGESRPSPSLAATLLDLLVLDTQEEERGRIGIKIANRKKIPIGDHISWKMAAIYQL